MNYPSIEDEKHRQERTAAEEFLESPSEASFYSLFRIFSPQLTSFFRARGCELALSEDLAQDVMFTVYRKADQLRDRTLFRAWLFKIARSGDDRPGKSGRSTAGLESNLCGNAGFRISRLDGVPRPARARGAATPIYRRMGVSRDRRCARDSDRHRPVACFQCEEKAGTTPETAASCDSPGSMKGRSGLVPIFDPTG